MKRSTPLRSSAAKSWVKPARRLPAVPENPVTPRATLRIADGKARAVVPVPKADPLQHQGYMRLVRALPCAHCGTRNIARQFCHSDEGKGTGIKSDCRLGWPGCAACHYMIGTQRIYPKQERRELEARYARQTREAISAAGTWPRSLPLWKETA